MVDKESGVMRGIPKEVWADGKKIMANMGNIRMPVSKKECVRHFGREPKDEYEARRFALRLRKSRREVRFDNIITKGDKKKSRREDRLERKKLKERGIVKVELNNVRMKDGQGYPTTKVCIEVAVENGSALVEREITEKDELNLKLNVLGKRTKVDKDGQKAALGKIIAIMEALGIDESTKITFSDQ